MLVFFNITTLGKINTDRTWTIEPGDVTFLHQNKLKCKDRLKYVILNDWQNNLQQIFWSNTLWTTIPTTEDAEIHNKVGISSKISLVNLFCVALMVISCIFSRTYDLHQFRNLAFVLCLWNITPVTPTCIFFLHFTFCFKCKSKKCNTTLRIRMKVCVCEVTSPPAPFGILIKLSAMYGHVSCRCNKMYFDETWDRPAISTKNMPHLSN